VCRKRETFGVVDHEAAGKAMASTGAGSLAGGNGAIRHCASTAVLSRAAARRDAVPELLSGNTRFSRAPGVGEAVFVLVLSLSAGWYFFLPSGELLLPAGWAFVGGLNIAIIIILKAMAEQLARANEQQRLLFEELQHRVANTLQVTAGSLERLRKSIASSNPSDCAELLDEAIRRMLASADMHRRLHDPLLFNQGVEAMLREVVTSVVDQSSVALDLDVEELDLSLDQKSAIAMLVMEVANNSTKHVFQRNLGSSFKVTLKRLPNQHALLTIRDDRPGIGADDAAPSEQRLGMRILHGLADQLHGSLTADPDQGTAVTVTIPLLGHARWS
jgi:two-component sensor histidine kinase